MEFRKTEKYINGKWNLAFFEQLLRGDKFRLFEKSGDIVLDKNRNSEFTAISDAYMCEPDGNFGIEVKEK